MAGKLSGNVAEAARRSTSETGAAGTDWTDRLPMLSGEKVILRELCVSDAPALLTMITTSEVARFVAPPPATIEGFERFIIRAQRQRSVGTGACFAVTLKGLDTAIGMFQLREIEPRFNTGEWGFAIGSAYWGTGTFQDAATLVLDFAFGTLGAHRLEARASVKNGRGNRALQKLGAVPEGVLRNAFLRNGEYTDQVLYGIVADDWRASRRAVPTTSYALVH